MKGLIAIFLWAIIISGVYRSCMQDNNMENNIMYVTTALNVRENPTKHSNRIDILYKGQTVSIVEESGNWAKVEYIDRKTNNKRVGWVYKKYLAKKEELKPSSNEDSNISQSGTEKRNKKDINFDFSIVLGKMEIPSKIIETHNKNYFIVGSVKVGFLDFDAFVMSLDKNGKILFKKNVNTGYSGYTEELNSVIEFKPGNLIAIGSAPNPFKERGLDVWVISLDEKGIKRWEKFYDKYKRNDEGISIEKIDDSSFLISGFYVNTSDGGVNAFFMKIASNGKSLSELEYGETSIDEVPKSIIKLDPYSIVSIGYKQNYSSHLDKKEKIWITKISTIGNLKFEWNKTLPTTCYCKYISNPISIVKINSNFLIVTNIKTNDKEEILLIKINENGEVIWEKILSTKNMNWNVASFIKGYNENYYIIGVNEKNIKTGQNSIVFIKIDSEGNIIGKRKVRYKNKNIYLIDAINTDDKGIIAIGAIGEELDRKGWVFKIKQQ